MSKVAELFYPKELKDLIADLRAKNDLNEKSLANINLETRKNILSEAIILVFVGFSVSVAYGLFDIVTIAVVAVTGVCILIDFFMRQRYLTKVCVLLAKGNRMFAKIDFAEKITPSFVFVGWHIKYSYKISNNISTVFRVEKPFLSKEAILKKGDKILIAVDPNKEKRSICVIEKFEELFYLKKEGSIKNAE